MTDKLSNRLAKADDLTNDLANNLTNDNEIIRGLERMSEEDPDGFSSDLLNLINRQKAEIERLKQTPKCVYAYDGKTVEYCVEGPCSVEKTIDEIKSEAVREFAERLKAEIKSDLYGDDVMPRGTIDWLVKEMAGDTDER